MDITLDSNVLVYAFVPPIHRNKEKREEWNNLHIKAKKIYESVIRGKQKLILPLSGEYQFNVRLFRSMDLDDLNF